MKFYESPKSYYNTVKLSCQIMAIWPLKIGASDTEIMLHELKWWILFLNVASLIIPLVLGTYYFLDDSVTLTKILSEFTAVFELFMNLIQAKVQNSNFQVIIEEMDNFIENANEHEERTLKKYLKNYKFSQLNLGISFLCCGLAFMCMPLLTPQPLPTDGWYPFSIEPYLIHTVLYISQAIVIGQVAVGFMVDFFIATMLWYCAVKTELLKEQISEAKGKLDLKRCASQHQLLVLYTNRVENGIKYMILKTNFTMFMAIVCGAFQLINHEPLQVIVRFMCMVVAGSVRLYVSAKPADDLKENSEHLVEAACWAASHQQSTSDAKMALMLAQRCSKTIVISVTSIIEAYNLQYYGSFLATSVKYFVNLRAVFEDK